MTNPAVSDLDELYARAIRHEAMSGDVEADHKRADELLAELVRKLGFVRTFEAFDELEKWYA